MRRALFLLTLLLALPTAVYAQSHLDAEPGVYLNLGEVRAGSFTLDGTYTRSNDEGPWTGHDVGLGGPTTLVYKGVGASLGAGYRFQNGFDAGLRLDAFQYTHSGDGYLRTLQAGPRLGYTHRLNPTTGLRFDAEALYSTTRGDDVALVRPLSYDNPTTTRAEARSQRLVTDGSVSAFHRVRLGRGLAVQPALGVYYRLSADLDPAQSLGLGSYNPNVYGYDVVRGSGTREDYGLQLALPVQTTVGGTAITLAPTFRYSLNGDGLAGGHGYGGAGLSVNF